MAVALAAFFQQTDRFGVPLAGGKLWTYDAGTTNLRATFTDQTGAVANTNPVILDAAGRAPVWMTANVPYKLVLTDAAGVIMGTLDNYYAGASPEQLTIAGIVPATGGDYTGPVNFNGGALFNGTPAQDLATLNSLGAAGVAPANLWTNPEFLFAQRDLGSVADGAFAFDRVIALSQSSNVTSGAFDPLGLAAGGNAGRLTQTNSTPQRLGIAQIVEAFDCASYRNSQMVFAGQLRCSAAATVRMAILSWAGTKNAGPRDAVNNWTSTTYTAGNFFAAGFSVVATAAVTLPASGWTDFVVSSASAGGVVVPTAMNNLHLVVWTDQPLAQGVALDFTAFRASRGTVAPLYATPNTQTELNKCLRFFYRNTPSVNSIAIGSGFFYGTTQASVYHPFPALMRAAPAITFSNAGTWTALVAPSTITNLGGASPGGAGPAGTEVFFTAAAANTAGAPIIARAGTLGNYLQADAEIGV